MRQNKALSARALEPAWAAAGFVDAGLSFLSFLELYRTDVAERRMAPGRVVKPFDEIGQWFLCGRPSHW
jgi:hypothetical protein